LVNRPEKKEARTEGAFLKERKPTKESRSQNTWGQGRELRGRGLRDPGANSLQIVKLPRGGKKTIRRRGKGVNEGLLRYVEITKENQKKGRGGGWGTRLEFP